jgi:hypothetical protein
MKILSSYSLKIEQYSIKPDNSGAMGLLSATAILHRSLLHFFPLVIVPLIRSCTTFPFLRVMTACRRFPAGWRHRHTISSSMSFRMTENQAEDSLAAKGGANREQGNDRMIVREKHTGSSFGQS